MLIQNLTIYYLLLHRLYFINYNIYLVLYKLEFTIIFRSGIV